MFSKEGFKGQLYFTALSEKAFDCLRIAGVIDSIICHVVIYDGLVRCVPLCRHICSGVDPGRKTCSYDCLHF